MIVCPSLLEDIALSSICVKIVFINYIVEIRKNFKMIRWINIKTKNAHSRFIRFFTWGEKFTRTIFNIRMDICMYGIMCYMYGIKLFRDRRNCNCSFERERENPHGKADLIWINYLRFFIYIRIMARIMAFFFVPRFQELRLATQTLPFRTVPRRASLEHFIANESLLFQITKNPRPILTPRGWGQETSSFRVLIRIVGASSRGKGTWRVIFAINAARSLGSSVPTATTCARSRPTYENTFGSSIRIMMSMSSIFFSSGKSFSELLPISRNIVDVGYLTT